MQSKGLRDSGKRSGAEQGNVSASGQDDSDSGQGQRDEMRVQAEQTYSPLEREARTHVETACAAFHLTRKPQTMRAWACLENGPIRPIRINGRLAWSVKDIRGLLSGN